ncbi:MAG: hypothetical protein ABIP90_06095 [Vicinamibacterales bacterium]
MAVKKSGKKKTAKNMGGGAPPMEGPCEVVYLKGKMTAKCNCTPPSKALAFQRCSDVEFAHLQPLVDALEAKKALMQYCFMVWELNEKEVDALKESARGIIASRGR